MSEEILHLKHRILSDIRKSTERALRLKETLDKEDSDHFIFVCTLLTLLVTNLTEAQVRMLMSVYPEVKNMAHVDRALGETVEVGHVSDNEQKEISLNLEELLKRYEAFKKSETVYAQQEHLVPLYEALLRVTCIVGDFITEKPSSK